MEIYILRHGIAEERAAGRSDRDRALTPEGRRKLERVLGCARAAKVAPSLILSSPYRRAMETAQAAAEVLEYSGKVVAVPALEPGGSPQQIWQEIRERRQEKAILLAGHEPLLSQTVGFLLNAPTLVVDLKKGALVRIDFDRLGNSPQGALQWLLTPKLAAASAGNQQKKPGREGRAVH